MGEPVLAMAQAALVHGGRPTVVTVGAGATPLLPEPPRARHKTLQVDQTQDPTQTQAP